MPQVTVRYFAAARAAAGARHDVVDAECIGDVLEELRGRYDARFAAVLGASSLLVDGVRLGDEHARLSGNVELHVLPPFAGG